MELWRAISTLLLACSVVVPGTVGLAAQNEESPVVPYRIVLERQPDLQNTVYHGYEAHIAVEEWLDRMQIETLLCRLLKDRLPTSYSSIAVHIWWRHVILDYGGSRIREANEHIVAAYLWSTATRPGWLTIWHDQKGNRIRNDSVTFDHLEKCGIPSPPLSLPAKPDANPKNQ